MDWQSLVSGALAGGAIGGSVSLWVSRQDRKHLQKRFEEIEVPAAMIERERWDYERTADQRRAERQAYDGLQDVLHEMNVWLNQGLDDRQGLNDVSNRFVARASVALTKVEIDGHPRVLHWAKRAVRRFQLAGETAFHGEDPDPFIESFVHERECMTRAIRKVLERQT